MSNLDPKATKSIARTQLVDEENVSAMFEFAAVTVVDINNQKVFRGVTFGLARRFSIAKTDSIDIVIDPQAIPEEKSFVLLPFVFSAIGGGPVNIDIYFGTTSSEDGTLWETINRDTTSPNTADTTVRFNPTISDPGTKLALEYQIQSNGTAAVAAIGGAVKEDFILRLRKDGKYLIRATNIDTVDDVQCTVASDFFEVAEGI